MNEDEIKEIFRRLGMKEPVQLLGVRGYYQGKNQRGLYDDAIFLQAPGAFVQFDANTDPMDDETGRATLDTGCWLYELGVHGLSKPVEKQYRALVQAKPVTVIRADLGKETGFFGINIHCGGYKTTGSQGCQTIYPAEWNSFISLVETQMSKHFQNKIPYGLVQYCEM